MGSLCCVAARPHESHGSNREQPVGPYESYWLTNTSFSPSHPRWDYHFQSEGPQYGSNDSIQLLGSTSSNSKESMSWLRGYNHPTHQCSASDSGYFFFTSPPSDASHIRPIQGGSISFGSDRRELDYAGNLTLSSSTPRNFPNRHCFMSNPIHPLSFPIQPPTREAPGSHHLSSGCSSIDFTDFCEPHEYDFQTQTSHSTEAFKCGLCNGLLSQRSPWSSRQTIKSGDMPVSGVLSCRHIFHAECLEQTTPTSHRSDPACPLCPEVENPPKQQNFAKLRNTSPRPKPFDEDGSSRNWSCVHAVDCVNGARHTPHGNSMMLLNRNRMKKNQSPNTTAP